MKIKIVLYLLVMVFTLTNHVFAAAKPKPQPTVSALNQEITKNNKNIQQLYQQQKNLRDQINQYVKEKRPIDLKITKLQQRIGEKNLQIYNMRIQVMEDQLKLDELQGKKS